MASRRSFILSMSVLALGLTGCGSTSSTATAPDLPASVPPLWTRTTLATTAPPPEMQNPGTPPCWKADYSGPGTAQAWICKYPAETMAFDVLQRTQPAPNSVKFQEGNAFAFIRWDKATRDQATELVHAVQRSLKKK